MISSRDFETARGTARGLAAGDNAMRVIYQNIVAESYDGTVTGQSLFSYEPGQGFFLKGIEEKVQTYRFTRP